MHRRKKTRPSNVNGKPKIPPSCTLSSLVCRFFFWNSNYPTNNYKKLYIYIYWRITNRWWWRWWKWLVGCGSWWWWRLVVAMVAAEVVWANLSLFLTYIERCVRTTMFINSFLFARYVNLNGSLFYYK